MKPDRIILICGKNCMPCRQLEEWMQDHEIEVETIFGEDNLDLCKKYQVMRTPTLLLITDPKDEEECESHLLYSGFDEIVSYFESR